MIPRLYVEAGLESGREIAADERARHYLRNVLRRRPGDALVLFNGSDGEFAGNLASLGKRGAVIVVGERRRRQDAVPDLWLCFAPLKKQALDFLVEKGCELGVSLFQPVVTAFTQPLRLNEARLRANIVEAAEQTERLTLPALRAPLGIDALLATWPAERRLLFCAESGSAIPIAEALTALKQQTKASAPWAILCGPEGGFAPSELDRLRDLPFVMPVGLGPRILRAETAALAALACFQAILGDGGDRPPEPMRPIA